MAKHATPLTIAIICIALAAPIAFSQAHTPASQATIRASHQKVLDALNVKDEKGELMNLADPRIPSLVRQGWHLAGSWASLYLDSHASPSESDLDSIFDGFAPEPHQEKSRYGNFIVYTEYGFQGIAMRLSNSLFVVEVKYYSGDFPTGTFMVVAKNHEGEFQELWNIKDLAEKHYAQSDEIGRWMHLTRRAYYSGPLAVDEIQPMSPAENGHSRFLVLASQGADGGTMLHQLSIWEWTGSDAVPLLVDTYKMSLDYGRFSFDGSLLHTDTKEKLKSLYSCGGCSEPKGFWEVRITSKGVENLGHHLLNPEYAWTDELLTKIQNQESTTQLAALKVERAIREYIAVSQVELNKLAKKDEKLTFSWGMLSGLEVIQRGQSGIFSISTDEATFTFSYVLRHGKPFFTKVHFN